MGRGRNSVEEGKRPRRSDERAGIVDENSILDAIFWLSKKEHVEKGGEEKVFTVWIEGKPSMGWIAVLGCVTGMKGIPWKAF